MIKIFLIILITLFISVSCLHRGEYFEFHGEIVENFRGWVATDREKIYGFIPPTFSKDLIRGIQNGQLKEIPIHRHRQFNDDTKVLSSKHEQQDSCHKEIKVNANNFIERIKIFDVIRQEFNCGNCHGKFYWISSSKIKIFVACNDDKKIHQILKHLNRRKRRDFLEGSGTDEDFLHYDEEDEEEDEDHEDESEDIDNQVFNNNNNNNSTTTTTFIYSSSSSSSSIPTTLSPEVDHSNQLSTPKLPEERRTMTDDEIDNEIEEERKKVVVGGGRGGGEEEEEEEEEELLPSERIVLLLPTPSYSGFVNVVAAPTTVVAASSIIIGGGNNHSPVFIVTAPAVEQITEQIFSSPTYPQLQHFSSSIIFQDHLLGSGDGPLEEILPTKTSVQVNQSPQLSYNNNPPHLQKSIPKQAVPFGKIFSVKIDSETFYDQEENTNNLSLFLSPFEPWIYFDKKNLELWALPTIHEVSDWKFELIAVDKDNLSSIPHEVSLSVRQRPKSRNYNHLFILTFARLEIVNGLEFKFFFQKICQFLNSCDHLVVWEVQREYPYSFSFVNESLVIGGSCPVEDLKRIYKKLSTNNLPSAQLNRHMRPTFKIESVNIIGHPSSPSLCDVNQIQQIKNLETKQMNVNFPPTIKNQIDILNATVGKFLIYKVKADFCYDPEDGDTTKLDLTLLDGERRQVLTNFWLQFDKKNREFFGLPMDKDEQRSSFVLNCQDKQGKSANDALEVKIFGREAPQNYNSEFSLQFKSLPFTPINQRKFLEKLALAFNCDLDMIVVKSISESNGHVLLKWYNATNPSTEYEVTELRRILLSNEGPPEKKLVALFAPEFNLSVGNIVPRGRLLGADTPIHFEKDPEIDEEDIDKDLNPDDYSNYLLTYVIPSVLIAVMILLALIIACLLSRAKSKNIPVADEDEKKNFIKKGVPVIFVDELDDDKLIQPECYGSARRSKSPQVVGGDGVRSSTPQPPEYQPRKYRKDNLDSQPNYQPPPAIPYQYHQQQPFRQQPLQTNPNYGYRKPPPYVPP